MQFFSEGVQLLYISTSIHTVKYLIQIKTKQTIKIPGLYIFSILETKALLVDLQSKVISHHLPFAAAVEVVQTSEKKKTFHWWKHGSRQN